MQWLANEEHKVVVEEVPLAGRLAHVIVGLVRAFSMSQKEVIIRSSQ